MGRGDRLAVKAERPILRKAAFWAGALIAAWAAILLVALLLTALLPPGSNRPVSAPGPLNHAAEAAVADLHGRPFIGDFTVVPGSLRAIGNREARGMDSVLIGTRRIAIKRRHLPEDENCVIVIGIIAVTGEFPGTAPEPHRLTFIAYLKYQPSTGRHETLDVDVHR